MKLINVVSQVARSLKPAQFMCKSPIRQFALIWGMQGKGEGLTKVFLCPIGFFLLEVLRARLQPDDDSLADSAG